MGERRQLLRANAVLDAAGVSAAPGALLLEGSKVIAAGRPQEIGTPDDATVHDIPGAGVLIPALVNAHAHLDLTSIGPQPFEGDFVDWIRMIMKQRMAVTDAEIEASVTQGVELARRGGTALIGDIAGNSSTIPTRVQRDLKMPGVSYIEFFGLGDRQDATILRMRAAVDNAIPWEAGVAIGISPHAPFTCGPRVYSAAARLGVPFSTHLAESAEELEFTASRTGPFADFLRELGLWSESIDTLHSHPVEAIAATVDNLSILAAHLNDVNDHHLELLAQRTISVAYCPRASAYFQHTGHRYRDMLAAGVNVCLGTDSIVCLDTPDRLSVLDEMRLLHHRDGTPPEVLLRMATVNGARALGFDESMFTFAPGSVAGALALDAGDGRAASAAQLLAGALAKPQAPQWALGPVSHANFTRP